MSELMTGRVNSPFGELWLVWDDSGVREVSFDKLLSRSDAGAPAPLQDDARADQLLKGLLHRSPLRMDCFNLVGTPFQQQVWNRLLAIPTGEVTTYQELANDIGRPKAVRAVANAVGANPIAWLIPCHRVIRSDGGLGGYRWGVERKRAMLDWEQKATREAA